MNSPPPQIDLIKCQEVTSTSMSQDDTEGGSEMQVQSDAVGTSGGKAVAAPGNQSDVGNKQSSALGTTAVSDAGSQCDVGRTQSSELGLNGNDGLAMEAVGIAQLGVQRCALG